MPMKFVVDWLNGRAKGFTTPTGNEEVRATSWSTGKVGMIGTSYEGTLPLAAATTGVKGLEVVVPVSPNTSYYHYYRSNGLVRSPAATSAKTSTCSTTSSPAATARAARTASASGRTASSPAARGRIARPATTTISGQRAICCRT